MKDLVQVAFFAYSLFSPCFTIAQGQDINATRDLSLAQALELVQGNAENLDVPRSRIESARARLHAVGSLPTPELRLRHDDGRLSGESSQEYALRLRLNNPWEIRAIREEGHSRVEVARIQLKLAEHLLAKKVRLLYFETLYLQRNATLSHEISEAQMAISSALDKLVAARQLTLTKALESRLDASETQAEAAENERAYEHSISTLRAYLDFPDHQSLKLVTSFSKPDANASALNLETLFASATSGRTELLSLKHEANAARARVRQAEARRIPWFSFLQSGLEHNRRLSSDSDQWGILIGIEIPLWGHRADFKAANAELKENLAIQRLAHRDLRLALANAMRDYNSSSQRLAKQEISSANLELDIAPALEENADGQGIDPVSRNRLKIGLLKAQHDLLKARHQFQSARIALEDVLGQSLDIKKIN